MAIENKLKSAQVSKAQAPTQPPVTISQGTPSKQTLSATNAGNIIVDEKNGVVYFKGLKKTVKITGSLI